MVSHIILNDKLLGLILLRIEHSNLRSTDFIKPNPVQERIEATALIHTSFKLDGKWLQASPKTL